MVNLCDDTHHLNAIFKAGRRATNEFLTGDLVAGGTMLVTPDVHVSICAFKLRLKKTLSVSLKKV